MQNTKSTVRDKFNQDCQQCQIQHKWIALAGPLLILGVLAVFLLIPVTTKGTQWLLGENHPIELLTFVFALWAAFRSFKLSRREPIKKNRILSAFYLLFALLFFFFAMEEISWGQQFLKFSTPEFWRVRNVQDELTLHNYDFIGKDYLEIYPLIVGLVGLAGIWANWTGKFPKLFCPPLVLFSWFAAIVAHSSIDLFHDFYIFNTVFDDLINYLDEAVEMLVAMSGLLFVYFNARRLSPKL